MTMAEGEPFTGFGPDLVAFLAGLEADNSKAYFDAHRKVYDDQVRRPLQQLCLAVGDRLAAGPVPDLRYEPKVGRSMFRINRDLRFSKDPTPYHPHLDLAWWHGDHPKTSPAFIMRIRHDEVLTGVGVFALTDHRLDRYRAAVVGEPGRELDRIVAAITAAVPDASLSEPGRKRVPKGFDAEHPRARYLLHDGLHLSGVEPLPSTVTSAAFADHVVERLGRYVELHRWLVAHT
ncbi:MAG: DUF2461 domain-containing protein [Acidimicrobiales bacterium]